MRNEHEKIVNGYLTSSKIMKRFNVDIEEAMDILDIPDNERDTYRVKHCS